MKVIDETKWDAEAEALIDDGRKWYWRGHKRPDINMMQKQHDTFIEIMRQGSRDCRAERSRQRQAEIGFHKGSWCRGAGRYYPGKICTSHEEG